MVQCIPKNTSATNKSKK